MLDAVSWCLRRSYKSGDCSGKGKWYQFKNSGDNKCNTYGAGGGNNRDHTRAHGCASQNSGSGKGSGSGSGSGTGSYNSYTSCKHGQKGCISVDFHGRGCSAGATEKHNLAEGRCVRAMSNGKPDSNMLKASCNSSSGTMTVLEYANASNCSGPRSSSSTFSSGSKCSSNYPIKIHGCGERVAPLWQLGTRGATLFVRL